MIKKIGLILIPCRKDSFITHRAFCDALAEENAKAQPQTLAAVKPNSEPDTKIIAANSSPPVAPSPPSAAAPAPPQSNSTAPSAVVQTQNSGRY